MSGSQKSALRDHLSRLGILAQAGLVAGVLFIVWLPVASVAYAISGNAGTIASAVAAALCLVGAEFALIATLPFSRPSAAMYSLAVGMLARTLIPLASGVVVHLTVPVLAGAGMVFYLLFFYMTALATETVLMLAKVPPSAASTGRAV
ncbi:MAG: hypothetical protein WD063_04410 [Pirellulales bacterium]